MKPVFVAVLLAFGVLAGAATSAFAGGPILVELYTSQGCSSCPPADALLAKLTQHKELIALSLPITYWDMLGWKDTLASEANTRRQKAYAAAMGRGGVYTPQIIVGGEKDVVGSREDDVEAAIDAAAEARDDASEAIADAHDSLQDISTGDLPAGMTALGPLRGKPAAPVEKLSKLSWSVGIGLTRTPQSLRVAIAAAPDVVSKNRLNATIWMFRLRSAVTVHIGAGENSGRTWTYRNVVSDIKDLGRWNGRAVSLELPPVGSKAPPHDGVVVVLQQGGYGRVLGAAYLGHAEYYAQR
jgi:hypothetical protein